MDALLAAFKLAGSAVGRVTLEDGVRPSPRTCACLVACPVKVASPFPPSPTSPSGDVRIEDAINAAGLLILHRSRHCSEGSQPPPPPPRGGYCRNRGSRG